ncbi:MAG: helix-turn-helix domain-containing protein [Pirellulaceae bacterium]|nr:helix-turn-helix domain-containing protein [Pirellulaceae bacterium]
MSIKSTTFSFPLRSLDALATGAPTSAFLLNRFYGDRANQLVGRWCDHTFMETLDSPWSLVLYGPSGTGKSALAETLACRKKLNCLRLTGDEFRRQFLTALATKSIADFRQRRQDHEMFVIENLCLPEDEPSLIREFIQFIEYCEQNQKPLVVTAVRLPALHGALAGVRSRLSAGLVIEINRPGLEARRAIAADLLKRFELRIMDEDLDWWANWLPDTAPLIRNQISKIALAATDSLLTRDIIKTTSRDPDSDQVPQSTKILLKLVSRRYGVQLGQMLGNSRRKEVVRARSVAMYLTRELTDMTFRQIGESIGDRDPSTVRHAYAQIQKNLQTDPLTVDAVLSITADFQRQTSRGKTCLFVDGSRSQNEPVNNHA